MAVNDKGAGPILGQSVLYQISGTHAILPGVINGINATGTVNITQNPAPGSVTFIDRATVNYSPALDGLAANDNRWSYNAFF